MSIKLNASSYLVIAPSTVEELQEHTYIDMYKISKILPFFIKDLAICFIQVEAMFKVACITNHKSKAHHMIMSLGAETIAC